MDASKQHPKTVGHLERYNYKLQFMSVSRPDSRLHHASTRRANTLRLRTALIAGVFCFAFMYGLFGQLMNMQFFEGLLLQYLW
jgi:hypothetical protein